MKIFCCSFNIIAACLYLLLGGCSNGEFTSKHNNSKEPASTANNNIVDMVAIINAKEQQLTPMKAAINQYQFVYKNKKKSFPPESSVINEATVGEKSVVILNTQNVDNNFVIFDYQREMNQWEINGLITLDVVNGEHYKDKHGLNLPFDDFVAVKYNPNNDPLILAFASKEKIAVIAKYKQLTFEKGKEISSLKKNGREVYISENNKGRFLYYYDADNTVVISGNISKNEMVSLAYSIPAIDFFDKQ